MNKSFFRLQRTALLLIVVQFFAACASQQTALDQTSLKKQYFAAVIDARTAETSEISKNLVAIIPSNQHLVWRDRNDSLRSKILVATWTNYNGYDDKIGKQITLTREVWVTTVPEVKKFGQKVKKNIALRLEQLLGLPPNNGKTKFVEMWVNPADLFRPSADPEISDCEAEIDFPVSSRFITVSIDHKNWFNKQKSASYGDDGYPWTRLGYTYDWGGNHNHIGLSEFVIAPGATVEIHSVSPTLEYLEKSGR